LIEARQRRLAIQNDLSNLIKIPLRHDPNAPNIQTIPIQKRIIKPLPIPASGSSQPEWEIDEQDYQYILTVIRYVGRTFEKTPKTYAVHGEEDLRNIILANLNGHYKGETSGETFRHSGKTDILIDADGRPALL
jgi:hypothetical protein